MLPTERQISAAHDAWERTVTEWWLRKVSNYGMAGDIWVLEHRSPIAREVGPNEIAAHKFDGENAEQRARFMLRDKCIVAVLTAALSL